MYIWSDGTSLDGNILRKEENTGIFALICEELGWLTGLILMVVIGLLLYQIFIIVCITFTNQLYFESALSMGILTHWAVFTILAIGSDFNWILMNGMGIPFVNYGSTSCVVFFLEVGCLLAVVKKLKIKL